MSKDDKIAFGIIAFIISLIGAQMANSTTTRIGVEFGIFLMVVSVFVWVVMGILEKREKKKERGKKSKR